MFLSWIPVIGPIIQGITSMFTKYQDTALAKYQTDADVTKAQTAASTSVLLAFKDDINIRIARDIILFPTCVWTGLIVWDKIVDISWPWLVVGIKPLSEETGLAFLPYAVMTFLFGNFVFNRWFIRK